MRIIGLVLLTISAMACLPAGSTLGAGEPAYSGAAVSSGTGVYFNGQEISATDRAQLEDLVGGPVPPGRYAIDAQGNAGPEGQPPTVNLVALVRARQQQTPTGERPFSMYSTDTAGRGSSIVSEGGCTILSTPSGSLSSGC